MFAGAATWHRKGGPSPNTTRSRVWTGRSWSSARRRGGWTSSSRHARTTSSGWPRTRRTRNILYISPRPLAVITKLPRNVFVGDRLRSELSSVTILLGRCFSRDGWIGSYACLQWPVILCITGGCFESGGTISLFERVKVSVTPLTWPSLTLPSHMRMSAIRTSVGSVASATRRWLWSKHHLRPNWKCLIPKR